jgi:hypothetical protein
LGAAAASSAADSFALPSAHGGNKYPQFPLPSAMTCTHALKVRGSFGASARTSVNAIQQLTAKLCACCCCSFSQLPNYPSLEVMREKLELAITEGNQGFTLS